MKVSVLFSSQIFIFIFPVNPQLQKSMEEHVKITKDQYKNNSSVSIMQVMQVTLDTRDTNTWSSLVGTLGKSMQVLQRIVTKTDEKFGGLWKVPLAARWMFRTSIEQRSLVAITSSEQIPHMRGCSGALTPFSTWGRPQGTTSWEMKPASFVPRRNYGRKLRGSSTSVFMVIMTLPPLTCPEGKVWCLHSLT